MPDESAPEGPGLVGSIAQAVCDEPLTELEAGFLRLAKAESDRNLSVALGVIIRAHGHEDKDGRHYNFIDDKGSLLLRITPLL